MLAKLKKTKEIFAIKILKKSMVLEKDELIHTLTENNVLAKCQHVFLTQLHYSFQTPELLCFVRGRAGGTCAMWGTAFSQRNFSQSMFIAK